MKSILSFFLSFLFFSCNNLSNQHKELINDSTIKKSNSNYWKIKLDSIESSGLMDKSCQYMHLGNCLFRLCKPDSMSAYGISNATTNKEETIPLVTYKENLKLVTLANKTQDFTQDENNVIYSNVEFKSNRNNVSLKEFIEKDIAFSINQGLNVSKVAEVSTADNKKALLYKFSSNKTQQIVSYVETSKYIILIVLLAETDKKLQKNFHRLESVVKSFYYYGD
jgi:hypothetical protein